MATRRKRTARELENNPAAQKARLIGIDNRVDRAARELNINDNKLRNAIKRTARNRDTWTSVRSLPVTSEIVRRVLRRAGLLTGDNNESC